MFILYKCNWIKCGYSKLWKSITLDDFTHIYLVSARYFGGGEPLPFFIVADSSDLALEYFCKKIGSLNFVLSVNQVSADFEKYICAHPLEFNLLLWDSQKNNM